MGLSDCMMSYMWCPMGSPRLRFGVLVVVVMQMLTYAMSVLSDAV